MENIKKPNKEQLKEEYFKNNSEKLFEDFIQTNRYQEAYNKFCNECFEEDYKNRG